MIRRILLCGLTGLLVATAMAAAVPSGAARTRVQLHEPKLVDTHLVRLTGKVHGGNRVVVQRYAPAKNRWVRAKTVGANRYGKFTATVRTTGRGRKFRAKVGAVRSATYFVRAAPEKTVPVEELPATAPQDACGPQPKKADGSRWTCTVADDFSGTTLDRNLWVPQTAGYATGSADAWACYLDDPSVISVHDGALHLTVRKLPAPIACPGHKSLETRYVAGMVSTYRLFSQQYGRFEARFRNTATTEPGLHEAFWLWPDVRYSTGSWPAAGEIDIVETYSTYPNLAIPFLHYTADDNGGPVAGLNTAWNCAAKRGEFNTYTLEWTANRLTILVNGKTCLVNTSGDPAFKKRYIVALTQALGTAANPYGGRAPLPATMSIDHVRVWQ